MGYVLNDKIKDLKPYDPIAGQYNIRLDANESFLFVSSDVAAKMFDQAAFTSLNRYPDPLAEDVCAAFAEHYRVDAANVTAGNGSDELISVICNAFLMKGDNMITLSPDFSMYKFYSSIVEANCMELAKNEDLTIDVEQLITAANKNDVKMILFSNPCNPTSLGLKREQVRKLIRCVNALVVLDEAYMDFWDQSLLSEVNEYDNLIILRTCSKAFGMAAIRLGFAVANQTLTNAIKAVKSPYNVNSISQALGSVILKEHDLSHAAIREIIASKNDLYDGLKNLEGKNPSQIKVYESCTNFVFIKTQRAKEIYEYLLQNSIAIRFMGEYLRITAGTKAENAEVLSKLTNIL
ncbi:MAG TPA: histidinol-phosphate transaminase [Oscillospiraceae bacterium]|nr:histidinol-phosphate transaminase [Oscillospiraceae bacterium]